MWKKIQFLPWWKLVLCGKEGKETGQDGSSMPDGYNYIRKWNIQGKIRRRTFRINGTFRLKYDATLLRDRPFNSWGRGWGGGVVCGWFLVIKNLFFLAIWWAGYFFPLSFLLHLYACNFFLPTSACRKFFFKITHPSPQELNGRPLRPGSDAVLFMSRT